MLIKRHNGNKSGLLTTRESNLEMATYTELTGEFIEGNISKATEFTTAYTDAEIQEMLANPEANREALSDLIYYNYISNGTVYQLYSIYKNLPSLNYKICAFDNSTKKYEESISMVNKTLHQVKYKELTRDIIGQSALDGGVVCMWCGVKKNLFLYIFDNLEYVFPKYRVNGQWQCVMDLGLLEEMEEEERLVMFENLKPFVTESMYNTYQNDSSNKETKYALLPIERTEYIRGGDYLKRNQRVATPLGSQALMDINHKQQLKNLEKSVANRAIKSIAVLTVGSDKEGKSYLNIGANTRRQIVGGIGSALKQNTSTTTTQVPVATIPEFCKLEFNKIDGIEALGSDKYSSIDEDLTGDTGVSASLSSGTGSNNAGALINLDFLYKRIGGVLEQIDSLYDKMIKLVLGKKEAENLYFEFDKVAPLDRQSELELLYKLEAQGYSVKALIDRISGINFDDFIEQSLYEMQALDLRNQILPPLSSYTMSEKTMSTSSEEDPKEESHTQEEKVEDGSEDTTNPVGEEGEENE